MLSRARTLTGRFTNSSHPVRCWSFVALQSGDFRVPVTTRCCGDVSCSHRGRRIRTSDRVAVPHVNLNSQPSQSAPSFVWMRTKKFSTGAGDENTIYKRGGGGGGGGGRARPSVQKNTAGNTALNLNKRTNMVASKLRHRKAGKSVSKWRALMIEAESLMALWTTTAETRGRAGPAVDRLLRSVLKDGSNAGNNAIDSKPHALGASVHMFHYGIEAWLNYQPEHSAEDGAADPVPEGLDAAERWLRIFMERWEAGYFSTLRKYQRGYNYKVMIQSTENNRINSAFALVVHALLKSCADNGLGRAQELAMRMNKLYKAARGSEEMNFQTGLFRNNTAANAMLHILSRSEKGNSAEEAMLLLQHMVSEASSSPELEPNSTSFAIVIHHHALKGDVSGAESVMSMMESLRDAGTMTTSPDVSCFNALLDAYARSNLGDASEQAEMVLDRMVGLGVEPDAKSYNSILACHARSGLGKGLVAAAVAERAERVLRFMINEWSGGRAQLRPDAIAFTTVVEAWSKTGGIEAARRAGALVEEMEQIGEAEGGVAPNLVTYNALMRAWAKSRTKDGPHRVRKVLEHAKERGFTPDTSSCNALLLAFARSDDEDSLNQSKELLQKMEEGSSAIEEALTKTDMPESINFVCCRPDALSYATFLDCIRQRYRSSKGTDDDLLKEAEYVVQCRMPANGVPLEESVYHNLMGVYAHSGREDGPSRAMSLLSYMEEQSISNESLRPTSMTYNVALSALSRSQGSGRHREAWNVLQRMGKESFTSGSNIAQPDVNTYNLVLNCCAFAPGEHTDKRDAVEIALNVIEQMRRLLPRGHDSLERQRCNCICSPDEYTYATLLKVFGTNLPTGKERNALVEHEFIKCRNEGLVSEHVLTALQRATQTDVLRTLLPGWEQSYENSRRDGKVASKDLPGEWYRNVKR
mmetsp:Transcript_42594/g.129280  ORF Transcript_42594/g.129280 Transcript_42594/m.129280 type:complete len:925 (-) Transcript_42594:1317-4091(-)